MLLPFAERSIEGRESNEERADLPHRVLDSLPRTLHLSPISHGPRDAFGCGGRAVRAARGPPPHRTPLNRRRPPPRGQKKGPFIRGPPRAPPPFFYTDPPPPRPNPR